MNILRKLDVIDCERMTSLILEGCSTFKGILGSNLINTRVACPCSISVKRLELLIAIYMATILDVI